MFYHHFQTIRQFKAARDAKKHEICFFFLDNPLIFLKEEIALNLFKSPTNLVGKEHKSNEQD
jgi:hypothetical protein